MCNKQLSIMEDLESAEMTFAEIAAVNGVTLVEVEAIAAELEEFYVVEDACPDSDGFGVYDDVDTF